MGQTVIIRNANFANHAIGKIEIGVEIPVIEINASTKQVTLSTTNDLDIYYTTDASTPTTSASKYSAPFTLSGNSATIKAISSNGTKVSSVPKILSTINIEGDSATLALSSSVSGTIRYVKGTTDPTSTSTAYSSAIAITSGETYKVGVFSGSTLVSEVATIQITA